MPEDEKKCGALSGFNFCLWAKILVAIPTLPLIAIIASTYFENSAAKVIAALAAVSLVVYLSIKIDQIPALSKKIFLCKPKQ